MKRTDVRLKVGDRVKRGDGEEFTVAEYPNADKGQVYVGPYIYDSDGVCGGLEHDPELWLCQLNGEAIEDPRVRRSAERAKIADKMAAAMREFCDRVDAGEVRSRYTYSKFKTLLGEYDAIR